ncbi:MAG: copper homeostasis protein CutC [Dysgonamonadaceae bacterium]|nr:copper homeostasis protein CutC [Dysgonamonadaceae bacterium]
MDYKIEICANSVASCLEAQKGGAHRVELCAGIPEGGTTPSYGEIALAREMLNIKLNVIIRPRGGDFLYSDIEHQTMLHDIEIAKKLGVNGVVIGCLTADGEIDLERNKELIDAAKGISVTFHRAFDMCKDPFKSLEQIILLGCDRILSSGQQPTAEEGVELLKQLVKKADNRIIVMPGSGINEQNIASIALKTNAKEFHFSARESIKSKMEYRNPNLKLGGTVISIDEYAQNITDSDKVKRTISNLNSTI